METKVADQTKWTFGYVFFQFNGPLDNSLNNGAGESHILLVFNVMDGTVFDQNGMGTYTLVHAMTGVDIAKLTDWQDGWTYTVRAVTPDASVKDCKCIVMEFIVTRSISDGRRASSIMVSPRISYTPSDKSQTIYYDGCMPAANLYLMVTF